MEGLLIGALAIIGLFVIVRLFSINSSGGGKGIDAVAHGWQPAGGYNDSKTGEYVQVFIPKGTDRYNAPMKVALKSSGKLQVIQPLEFGLFAGAIEFDNFDEVNSAALKYLDAVKQNRFL